MGECLNTSKQGLVFPNASVTLKASAKQVKQMSHYLSPFSGAVELINTLIAKLKDLSAILDSPKTHIRIDAIYGLELRNTPKVAMDQEIPVRTLTGAEAYACAKEVLTSIHLKDGQNAKETLRAPGAIGLPRVALDCIENANQIRFELFGLVSLLDPKERKSLWKKFKYISSIQTLRTTQVLIDPKHITFYWHEGSSGKRVQVMELVKEWDKYLTRLHGGRPRMDDTLEGSVERKLVYAIDVIEHIDPIPTDEQVCIHRPVAPHIRARFLDSSVVEGNELPIVQAPTPFVYDLESPPPKIKNLRSFCPRSASAPGDEKRPRSIRAQLMEEPYIESLNIFRYMEGHRKFGPVEKNPKQRNKRLATSS
jgi:hypothetical protein